MYSIDIKNNKDIYDYCMQNGITDITKFVQDCFKQGYDIKKYGLLVKTLNEGEKQLKTEEVQEKWIEKEVIVEVVKEVPVDRVVEKIIYTTDDIQINELGGKITTLENDISKKDLELEELKNNKKIIIDINDKTKLLQETLLSLRKEIQLKNERIKKLEKINQDFESVSSQRGAVYLNGSNLNKRI